MRRVHATSVRDSRQNGNLALFSGTGFAPELLEAAAASVGRIQLIGLDRLYQGA
jgi:uncharacterized protein